MIEIPMSPNYNKNIVKGGAGKDDPCLICGKAIKNKDRASWLRVIGGNFAAEPGDVIDPASDCGFLPVGPDCRRKYPDLPYVEQSQTSRTRRGAASR